MELKEYISKNLGVPFVYLKDKEKYLCSNGVLFTKEEYLKGIDLQSEYAKREKEDQLYDYNYAKSTGLLRKKRASVREEDKKNQQKAEEVVSEKTENEAQGRTATIQAEPSDNRKTTQVSIYVMCALLAFTSAISMYISTLHTATYLKDYVDLFSSWLMSASVTAYNGTAFEVSVLFHSKKRNFIAFIFMLLWTLVTLFSMATTVSVFYDRYNFNETSIAEGNKETESLRLQLEVLQKKESDLRDAIAFKKKDIEYRQERDYATSAVRTELNSLENELQNNLALQQKVLAESPDASKKESETQKKESLFAFLGRILHIEGGIMEFTMSTLSAVFVNLIAPLSLTAVIELLYKKEEKDID